MAYDSQKHHRQSIRAKGYDYSEPGGYFVTICTYDRQCILGEVSNGKTQLSSCDQFVQSAWNQLPRRFPDIALDECVIMPNHIHGIIMVVGAQFIAPHPIGLRKGAINRAPTLGEIIRTFKAASTRLIRQNGHFSFAWQRNYYDHIMRSDHDLARVRQYIADNSANWEMDEENPDRKPR